MNAREAVLGRISAALGRDREGSTLSVADQPSEVRDRLNAKQRSTLPGVSDDLIDALTQSMESVLMSVVRLQSMEDCVNAVDWYLESEGIDASATGAITVAPALSGLSWPEHVVHGPASGVEKVSVTPCLAAVAETGSVVTSSDSQTPATLNFLPEVHIIVVRESQVVKHVDDVFPMLRTMKSLPRALNIITGPSRTADIEQTLEIGAHGPRRMHVLLIPG